MTKETDLTNWEILEGLATYGPRNISLVAEKLGMKADTVRKRLQRMPPYLFLKFRANIYCTNLGLKKGVVFAEAVPGYEDLLLECLKANDFWIYLTRCYGKNEGCIGVYTIPYDHSVEFLRFTNALGKVGVARNVRSFWSTCFQSVNSKTQWFDDKSKTWAFHWDEWAEEIPSQDTQLPHTLVDPDSYPVKADEIDVFLLKELEKNARVSLRAVAEALKVSPQVVEYHYKKHILERNLIEDFEALTFHFDMSVSDVFLFTFGFKNMEKCAKFATSLLDKPFVGGLGKILNESSLIVDIYLPRVEFRNLIDTLAKLVRGDWLRSYDYVILDLRKAKRQTISYKNFRNDSWIYNHSKHIRNLNESAKDALTD